MNAPFAIELTLLAAIWGASFLFQRVAAPVFGPVALVGLRVGIAAVILWSALVAQGKVAALRGHWRPVILVGAINSALPFSLFALATLSVPAGVAAILNGTVPFFTALIGWLAFGERLQRPQAAGLLLGFVGLLLLVAGDFTGDARLAGVTAGLGAALLYGVSAHVTRRHLASVDPFAVAAGSQVAAALLMVVPAMFLWPAAAPDGTAWGAALALGVICTGLAYVLFYRLIARVGPLNTVAVTYLIPIFGMLWGALFLRESVTVTMMGGAVILLAGVALTTGQWRRFLGRAAGRS